MVKSVRECVVRVNGRSCKRSLFGEGSEMLVSRMPTEQLIIHSTLPVLEQYFKYKMRKKLQWKTPVR